MTRRAEPIVGFTERPPEGPLRRVIDVLQALFGKVSAPTVIPFLLEIAGYTVTDAAGGAGTALTLTRTIVNFGDAGIDNLRLVVHGANSGAGSVIVTVHDVTNNAELCRVSVTDAAAATVAGDWTTITPTGADQQLELRCIGDGAFDPILYTAHLQGRTVQARV